MNLKNKFSIPKEGKRESDLKFYFGLNYPLTWLKKVGEGKYDNETMCMENTLYIH